MERLRLGNTADTQPWSAAAAGVKPSWPFAPPLSSHMLNGKRGNGRIHNANEILSNKKRPVNEGLGFMV